MSTPDELYGYHVVNFRQLDQAFDVTARLLRASLARDDSSVADVLKTTQTLLLGVWAEDRLAKLLYEKSGFSPEERQKVYASESLLERWQAAVDLGFRKHYGVRRAPLESPNLPFSGFTRYTELTHLLNEQLRPVLELRNRLAHGQWVYTLTNDQTAISTELMRLVNTENALSLQLKRQLLEHLSSAIHDLIVSPPTFDRDFDSHFNLIVQVKTRIKRNSYKEWVAILREKYAEGRRRLKASRALGAK